MKKRAEKMKNMQEISTTISKRRKALTWVLIIIMLLVILWAIGAYTKLYFRQVKLLYDMNIIIQISLNTRKYLSFDDKKEVKRKKWEL